MSLLLIAFVLVSLKSSQATESKRIPITNHHQCESKHFSRHHQIFPKNSSNFFYKEATYKGLELSPNQLWSFHKEGSEGYALFGQGFNYSLFKMRGSPIDPFFIWFNGLIGNLPQTMPPSIGNSALLLPTQMLYQNT